MRLSDELLEFLQLPLMCIVAASDADGRPAAGRGVGLHVQDDRESIDIIFSAWQWPGLESAVRQTGRLAVTFVSPPDYRTFQIKGSATIRDIEPGDSDRADRFMTAATGILTDLGVPPVLIAPWLTARGAKVAQLSASEAYIQTPGPHAGMSTATRL